MARTGRVSAERMECAVRRLQRRARELREGRPRSVKFNWKGHEEGLARECLARWKELGAPEPVNPLDDQELLDKIRIRVFGSAPNSRAEKKQEPFLRLKPEYQPKPITPPPEEQPPPGQ